MRKTTFFLGLLTLLVGLESSLNKGVQAQCIQGDVSIQYNISGSQKPTTRTNDVVMEKNPKCSGNSSITTGVQGNRGGKTPVEQHRRVHQVQTGGQGNPTGIDGSTVQIRSNVQVDVDNPTDRFEYKR
ncbi:hypothetical protein PCC8801_2293 [Rippkaea orientalis PCC 8801]|uniref:Uncharacterized protein n=1 Tax=Rippkaea orientalis (strain PCC 8801 / RF-1) TaxID=41431 RepID=B7K1B7_RIPO1|nr:hypothetical protein [Rippkaea orientalis]ACK66312.1 hypothetical protein PCC8801_2293 [Rippkaea orientalis PCC 8801]